MIEEYKKTTSAGGVIARIDGGIPKVLVLVTKSEGKGFLPKGHVEGDETLEEAALREVHEEAGLTKLSIVDKIGVYERRVDKDDIKEDKTIHYFLMLHDDPNERHEPLEESSNINFSWCELNKIPEMYLMENKDVIENNIDKIREILDRSAAI